MNSKYKLVYGSHRNSHCRNKKSKTLVGGCSVAVLCLATARTSCLTAVRTLPLTRRLSFPILPLGPWLSSPRRSLSTPLSTSRARSGITHEYSSTGRLSPYPSGMEGQMVQNSRIQIRSHSRITITFNDHIRIQDMKINQIQQASRSYSRSYITFNMNIPDIHIQHIEN